MLDEDLLYRMLVSQNVSEVSVCTFERLGEGQDNVVYAVNGNVAFRFPKSPLNERRLLREMAVLKKFAALLPLPVPNYRYSVRHPISSESGVYGFAGYELIPGHPLTDEVRRTTAWWRPGLLQFVRALHAIPVESARRLGVKTRTLSGLDEGATNWEDSLGALRADIRQLVKPILPEERTRRILDRFTAFLDDRRNFQVKPVLLHGDLTPAHLLTDALSCRITGVIDFGDCAIGDPVHDIWEELIPDFLADDNTIYNRWQFYRLANSMRNVVWRIRHASRVRVEEGVREIADGWC